MQIPNTNLQITSFIQQPSTAKHDEGKIQALASIEIIPPTVEEQQRAKVFSEIHKLAEYAQTTVRNYAKTLSDTSHHALALQSIKPLSEGMESMNKHIASNKQYSYLLDKAWDFSLDKNNEVVIIHDKKLTKNEEKWLQETISNSGVKDILINTKTNMINLNQSDRMLYASAKKYNLNSENFSDVIQFRSFYQDSGLNKPNSAPKIMKSFFNQLELRALDQNYQEKALKVYEASDFKITNKSLPQ